MPVMPVMPEELREPSGTTYRDSQDRDWYRRGARAEAWCHSREAWDRSARELAVAVDVLGSQGETGDKIVQWVGYVYTADWTLRARLRLAWRMITGPLSGYRLARQWFKPERKTP
jgi:hypothetical protein